MDQEKTEKKLEELAAAGNTSAGYLVSMLKSMTPGMKKILLDHATTGLVFADSLKEGLEDPKFVDEMERRYVKNG
jgi:hypothetical protein|tara:strand:+ start:683 stop:907 length:225 start_codon:yes stop_codon:yes gene_type:complete